MCSLNLDVDVDDGWVGRCRTTVVTRTVAAVRALAKVTNIAVTSTKTLCGELRS